MCVTVSAVCLVSPLIVVNVFVSRAVCTVHTCVQCTQLCTLYTSVYSVQCPLYTVQVNAKSHSLILPWESLHLDVFHVFNVFNVFNIFNVLNFSMFSMFSRFSMYAILSVCLVSLLIVLEDVFISNGVNALRSDKSHTLTYNTTLNTQIYTNIH